MRTDNDIKDEIAGLEEVNKLHAMMEKKQMDRGDYSAAQNASACIDINNAKISALMWVLGQKEVI